MSHLSPQHRRTLFGLLAVIVIPVCAGISSYVRRGATVDQDSYQAPLADASSELSPLWVDSYQPLADGVPPWPRGLSSEQENMLHSARRIIVATISPYTEGDSHEAFHDHRVLAARAFDEPDDITMIVSVITGSVLDGPTHAQEFYPSFAVRVISGDTDGRRGTLDLLIGPAYRGMYALTPAEMRFCVVDENIGRLLRAVTEGMKREFQFE